MRDVIRLKHRVASPCGTIPSALKKPTWAGSSATSCSTTSAIPKTWAAPKSKRSSRTWLSKATSPPPRTYGQALSALLFLYREVLKIELDAPLDSVRAKKPKRLPVVLTRAETRQIIDGMTGTYQLMAKLLYGSGLRLTLAPRLRAA
jgi:integrase